ncbi:hypothetical protein GALL_540980 [mine drainage metagenome]|uniref:Uncharacterized protein n=1 Tax=mine drainage metagenome TaxID=410659 RepID=A0A1J5P199_9ZZZZ
MCRIGVARHCSEGLDIFQHQCAQQAGTLTQRDVIEDIVFNQLGFIGEIHEVSVTSKRLVLLTRVKRLDAYVV